MCAMLLFLLLMWRTQELSVLLFPAGEIVMSVHNRGEPVWFTAPSHSEAKPGHTWSADRLLVCAGDGGGAGGSCNRWNEVN